MLVEWLPIKALTKENLKSTPYDHYYEGRITEASQLLIFQGLLISAKTTFNFQTFS